MDSIYSHLAQLTNWCSLEKEQNITDLHGSRKFCQGGSNSDNDFYYFYLSDEEGREYKDPNTTKKGHHLPALFCWRDDDGLTLIAGLVDVIFQGIWTSIALFVIFQGGLDPLPPIPLCICAWLNRWPLHQIHKENGSLTMTALKIVCAETFFRIF